jgi:rhodanese-related sulfurtransferase
MALSARWTAVVATPMIPIVAGASRTTLEDLLATARSRIERLAPAEAFSAMRDGALLVDIRSDPDRAREGIVPGSLHIPRTVLEWRVAPDSSWRNPYVGALDVQIVLLCDHGYSSSLAAATLVELGFTRVGDVAGGFEGWREAGLPVVDAPARNVMPGELAGMGPPDPAS